MSLEDDRPSPEQEDDLLHQGEEGLLNPNLSDLPDPQGEREAGASGGANSFWFPRKQGEYQQN